MAESITSESGETPLLFTAEDEIVDGVVDFKGRPAFRSKHGRWRSASFIIGVEVAERIAYYGVTSNLISYLTGPLGQSTAVAAANVNVWNGVASLLPVLGAVIADSFLGRYRTIVISSIIYILALGLLTLLAMLPSTSPLKSEITEDFLGFSPRIQNFAIFFSLYLMALGQSGHKPCVQAFGADQFDGENPEESKAKSSFFNWWYLCICLGPLSVLSFLNYIQDNLGWTLGFGIPCIIMMIALVIFVLGSSTYRFAVKSEERSALWRTGRVFASAIRNWNTKQSTIDVKEEAQGFYPSHDSQQLRFLNKAVASSTGSNNKSEECSMIEVEEAKAVLRLFPIWATSIMYGIVFSQSSTFFTKQGLTMERSITSSISIPPSSLQSFISLTVVLFIPIYDRIFVPTVRTLTRKPAGITMLQRIATGMFTSILSMVIAAIVEKKRLTTALEHGLIDQPNVTVPMSVWWLVPQYVLFGVADVFTMVGLQEFFYDQVPTELRSVGLSLYLSVFGTGSLLSGLLVSVIDKITGSDGQDSWFSNNLNRAHLDYFYWLLAGLSAVEIGLFVYFAKSYIYKRNNASM